MFIKFIMLVTMAILAVTMTGLLGLSANAALIPVPRGNGVQPITFSSTLMRHAVLPDVVTESTDTRIKHRQDAVHRCYRPTDEFGPAPSVEDCKDVIKQLQEVENDITVKLVEGCYKVWSGNCTGSVCPQRVGTSTIPPSVAAQYMTDSIMTECITNGLRGWYLDRDCGIGVYLT
ncbi:hypothetical protein M434DRAFT_375353 [Hypoxylon sp. CO27-5]|nr:hypothetical protein M434DRAFT_375353 [Hypoxylon sp. CO27-5]